MGRFYRFSTLCLYTALILLTGCASRGDRTGSDGPLTPLPDACLPQDPEDHVLDAAIREYLVASKGPLFTRYDFTRVDLDNDGRREGLVMMKGPHHYWCDTNGCSLVVFRAANDHFTVTSKIFPVRGPLYIGETTSQGWRDLIIRVSGQSYAKAKNVALQFDGQKYPRNPFFEPEMQVSLADHGLRLFP